MNLKSGIKKTLKIAFGNKKEQKIKTIHKKITIAL